MRFATLASCTVSALALTCAAPGWAQDAPPAAQADPAQADPAQADPAAQEETGEIVVSGFREALRSAQATRRNSTQIVDAVVAEDIGKLPDIAVSDTAARIPGIQVERQGGEASRVLVRGLDRNYYTTTYNGREIFTAETRSVALQDFPSGAISAVEAYKTSTANLVEPGLAGLINVRSRRPFDFAGSEIAGSVWANYPDQSRDLSPNANLLLSDRWDTGAGELGALINFNYTQLHYRDSIRRHGFFIAGLAGGRAPDWPEIQYAEADRWRPSINGALQWRPADGLEFYVEGLWQGYRERATDRQWAQPLWGGTHSNVVFREGTNFVESGTVTNPGAPNETWGYQGATSRDTNTYQFAVGGSYETGALRVTADVARTDSQFDLRTESVDYEINTNQYVVDYVIGSPGGPGPSFTIRGLDPTNPAIYNYRGFFEDHLTATGDDWQARLDFEFDTGADLLPKLQWGVRYVDRNTGADAGSIYWNNTARGCCGGPNPVTPISALPISYQVTPAGFRGDDDRPFPYQWLGPTFDSVRDNLVALRQFNIGRLGYGSTDGPAMDPNRTFAINERSLAGYAQANFAFDLGTVQLDGTIGMRAVRTDSRIEGSVRTPTTPPTPTVFESDYTDFLPNFNLRARLTPELQLRFAATQTRTRPGFGQLNPALNLDAPPGCAPGVSGCARTGGGGNPFLVPLESDNYDASIEYYFSPTGFAALTAFRRDMTGFITNRRAQFPEPDEDTGLPLLISGPFNTQSAKIQGFEAQLSTFFDFAGLPDFLRAFGIQANVTHIDATADYILFDDNNDATTGANEHTRTLPIPDVSDWNYNLVGMFERSGFSLRLAYNWRSGYAEGDVSQRDGFYTLQGSARSVSRLDWSSSYEVTPKVTLFFDWTNLLKKPFTSDIVRTNYTAGAVTSQEIFPMVYRFNESVMTGGIRFRF